MNKTLIAAITSVLFAAPALADKPETAGKGKPMPEQAEAQAENKVQAKAEPYRLTEEEKRAFAEKKAKHAPGAHTHDGKKIDRMAHKPEHKHADEMLPEDKMKGMEKQQAKKSEQERKELGKGSEKGQAAREEHSKKWWQFWK